MVDSLEATFPGLANADYSITSPRSNRYNCIAWAAGDAENWWWPGADVEFEFWPDGVQRRETIDAFREAFAALGYLTCAVQSLETGFEKIAVYANDMGLPKHAARQLPDGRWTSKLGYLEDIEHQLGDLEGSEYGKVAFVMKRPLRESGD